MQCKVCEYRLWNLKARKCPECGTPFFVSDYEFVPNSVQFCCPHCNQAYYGTGPKGHLVPEAFTCVTCNQPVHMNDMVLLPTEGLEEEQTQTFRVPWLERNKRGWVRSLFSMIGLAMFSPGKLMRALPVASSAGPAWWFMIVMTFLIPGIWAVPAGLVAIASDFVTRGTLGGMGLYMARGLLLGSALTPVAISVLIAIWGLTAHGLLRLTGKTFAGLGRTYQCLCYSSGASILSTILCFPYFGPVWWLVSAILMVKEGQRVHGGRAAFAVLTAPVLLGGTLIGLYIWFIVSMMGRIPVSTMPATLPGVATSSVATFSADSPIFDALHAYARQNSGGGPRHVVQLVQAGVVKTSDLLSPRSTTTARDIPVGRTRLDVLRDLPTDEQDLVVQQTIDSLPADTIAYRFGDFVFTYGGINLLAGDPNLWMLIEWPDPATNRPLAPNEMVIVHRVDAARVGFPVAQLKDELRGQNTLRKQYNLPPLPNPATITHDKPAVAVEKPES